jgi:hypothetical protein
MVGQFDRALYVDLIEYGTSWEPAQEAALTVYAFLFGDSSSLLHVHKDFAPRCLEALVLHCALDGLKSKKGWGILDSIPSFGRITSSLPATHSKLLSPALFPFLLQEALSSLLNQDSGSWSRCHTLREKLQTLESLKAPDRKYLFFFLFSSLSQ